MFFVYAGGRLAEVYQLKQRQERVKFPHQFCSPARSDHTVALLSNSPVKLMGVWVNTGIWGITQHWPGVCIWLRWYMQKFDGRFPVNWSCSAWCPCPCLSGRTWSKCFPSFYIFFFYLEPLNDQRYSDHTLKHTDTRILYRLPLRAPLWRVNQLGEEWAWQQLRGGPETHLSPQKQKTIITKRRNHQTLSPTKRGESSPQTKLPDNTGILRCCRELESGCEHVCPLAVLRHRDLSRGIPTVYLDLSFQLQESALPRNNILPRTTSAECCRQQPDLLLHMHSSIKGEKKNTLI